MDNANKFLSHYGVLGMKWGIRKDDRGNGRTTGASSATQSTSTRPNKITPVSVNNSFPPKREYTDPVADRLVRDAEQSLAEAERYGDDRAVSNAKKQVVDTHAAADAIDGKKGLTAKQKTLIGAGVTAGVLAIIGGVYLYKTHNKNLSSIDDLKTTLEEMLSTPNQKTGAKSTLEEMLSTPNQKTGAKSTLEEMLSTTQRTITEPPPRNTEAYSNFMKNYLGRKRSLFDEWDDIVRDPKANEPTILKAGQVFSRISTKNESDFLRSAMGNDKTVFASYKESDVTRYKAVLPYFFKKWGIGTDDMFVNQLKASVDIKIPSKKVRVNVLSDLLHSGEISLNEYSNILGRSFQYASYDDLVLDTYYDFSRKLSSGFDTIAGKKYLEKITSLGYNALVDDNNAGLLSDSPLIFFDPKNTLERIGSSVLSMTDVDQARSVVESMFK